MPSIKKKPKKYFKKRKKATPKKVGHTARVETAILETLGYRSIFNYPMSFYQINTFLLSKRKVRPEVLKNALNHLVRTRKLGVKVDKYYIYKNKTVPWKQRYNNSQRLLKRAQNISKILSKIPWIKFIGVTGSVAAFNGTKNDDIDFFIVTKAKRLWLTRGFVFLILKILDLLRTDEDPNRKICPNIFVDETNLAWDKKARNVYVAHEVVMLHSVFDRDDTYFRFIKSNDWAFKFFANLQPPDYYVKRAKINKNPLLGFLEGWAYKTQLGYMKKRKTKEVTKRNIIHFNKVDNTEDILGGYKEIKSKLGLKSK
ncbi:hypothetical protein HN803_06015 [candidate division WWE3 bacterium]|mgnify:FL=1|jgi:hypothetical protein|nr:hypothetical protein [candidate division WWE3 bacterium]MBT7350311.1 hypothetical protein [candidate division WWE3 bacterium]